MKTSRILAATVLALASVSAFADDINYPGTFANEAVAQKTRAQVKAEVIQAEQDGSLAVHAVNYPVLVPAAVSKTRQEVKAELKAAQLSRENGVVIGQ